MMTRSAQITLTVVSFLLGLLLVTQFYTQGKLASAAQTQSTSDQAMIISGLVEGNAGLRKEVAALESESAQYDLTSGETNLESMVSELNKLRIINGLVEVAGPGVEIKISGSVTALDLQDLMNEVRNAGAEALAMNGYRLVARSVVVGTNGSIVMDENRLTPPYRLQAIGDPQALERALVRKGGLVSLLEFAYPDATIAVARQDRMVLPLYQGKYEFRYARTAQ
jgi:uncharacterized protein YlxW (UPF0749 family)